MTTVRLKASDGFECPAYVAQPKGKPKGAVVVIQEIFGVNPHIREVADGYAAAGYFAIAPAMFHRAKLGVELGYTPDDMQAGMALKAAIEALPDMAFMADVQAAVTYAHQTSGAKVGIVGYCWGGLLTWRAAALVQGLSAAVPYYGGGSTTAEEIARHPHCPVMAHYAKQDHWIGLTKRRLPIWRGSVRWRFLMSIWPKRHFLSFLLSATAKLPKCSGLNRFILFL